MRYIWTNHALKRAKERKISQSVVSNAVNNPQKKTRRTDGSIELYKTSENRTLTVVVKKNDEGEVIIISCWINPPFPGTKDFRLKKRYMKIRNAHGMKKLWHMFLYNLGL